MWKSLNYIFSRFYVNFKTNRLFSSTEPGKKLLKSQGIFNGKKSLSTATKTIGLLINSTCYRFIHWPSDIIEGSFLLKLEFKHRKSARLKMLSPNEMKLNFWLSFYTQFKLIKLNRSLSTNHRTPIIVWETFRLIWLHDSSSETPCGDHLFFRLSFTFPSQFSTDRAIVTFSALTQHPKDAKKNKQQVLLCVHIINR